ncbi:transketolase C-terminal domain-containing protein [Oscillatoria laete-virens NRMC-F 0139]|nr:transketolase C-terminal domain-containing protein [Oscillatoria laete-virens]MDL5054238.1 transketolase C-terminal domain-containing protein [Oscillatoria laete-virens NRMC-F 0139]
MILNLAQEAAAMLEKAGFSTAIINARFAKPFDSQTLEKFAREADAILTFEDHVLMGGFGSIVLENLEEMKLDKPVARVGWPDEFVEHGKPDFFVKNNGLPAKWSGKNLELFAGGKDSSISTSQSPAAV